jgi:hypothetical protein
VQEISKLASKFKDEPQLMQIDEEESTMSPEFQNGEDDFSSDLDPLDVANVRGTPFEDCEMPVLKCQIPVTGQPIPARVLIDSGASVNLMSEALADKLRPHGIHERKIRGMHIRVANGSRVSVHSEMHFKISMGPQETELIVCQIMPKLPFEIIVGTETLKAWNAKLEWGAEKFSCKPGPHAQPVEVRWDLYKGQHWRRPITLLCATDIELDPNTQTIVGVQDVAESQWQGISNRAGLVTPIRTRGILSQKFATAYMYGKSAIDRVLVANTSPQRVQIKRGTPLAEFHPRSEDQWSFGSDLEREEEIKEKEMREQNNTKSKDKRSTGDKQTDKQEKETAMIGKESTESLHNIAEQTMISKTTQSGNGLTGSPRLQSVHDFVPGCPLADISSASSQSSSRAHEAHRELTQLTPSSRSSSRAPQAHHELTQLASSQSSNLIQPADVTTPAARTTSASLVQTTDECPEMAPTNLSQLEPVSVEPPVSQPHHFQGRLLVVVPALFDTSTYTESRKHYNRVRYSNNRTQSTVQK